MSLLYGLLYIHRKMEENLLKILGNLFKFFYNVIANIFYTISSDHIRKRFLGIGMTPKLGAGNVYKNLKTFLAHLRLYYLHWGNFVLFIILNLLRLLLFVVQKIIWQFNGVQNHMDLISQNKSYDLSAHVVSVLAACKPTPFDKIRPCFYLTWHHSFVHPNYILKENVILGEVGIKLDRVIFVELRKPVDHYKVKTDPFLHMTLVREAVQLIIMPISVFHRLSDELGNAEDRYEQVTFLFNAGRCGSTLIARMVEELDPKGTLNLSEPPLFFNFIWYKRAITDQKFRRVIRSTMNLLLKPFPGKTRALLRPTCVTSCVAEDFQRVMPKARFIFNHRDPLQLILAHERAFGASPLYRLLQLTFRYKLWYLAGTVIGFHRYNFVEQIIDRELKGTMFETCVIIWSDFYRRYKEQAERFYYPDLNYDDLLRNPLEFTKRLISLINLPSTVPPEGALRALASDSQEDTMLSQKVLSSIPRTKYSAELSQRTDRFCDALNLPRLNWDPLKQANGHVINHQANGHVTKHQANGHVTNHHSNGYVNSISNGHVNQHQSNGYCKMGNENGVKN